MQTIENVLLNTGRKCVVDAKGHDVFCGDIVIDSFANDHVVTAIEAINQTHAWIVTDENVRLIPHLVEKVES